MTTCYDLTYNGYTYNGLTYNGFTYNDFTCRQRQLLKSFIIKIKYK